jgi:hypothetical protein
MSASRNAGTAQAEQRAMKLLANPPDHRPARLQTVAATPCWKGRANSALIKAVRLSARSGVIPDHTRLKMKRGRDRAVQFVCAQNFLAGEDPSGERRILLVEEQ